jgi:tRNA dimethylallyltransferase
MAQREKQTVTVIAGPTASGKSALALALAERVGGTVINADSMQVYRGLETLTDQPDAAARARAPHRLYGVLDPAEACSAGRWRALALEAIEAALGASRPPIVVGGTGLYVKALVEGIAPVPEIPGEIRRAVRERHAALGNRAFHALLAERDPWGAAAIRVSDTQRMIRAAEVLETTGRPLSAWQAAAADGPPGHLAFRTILLMPPRGAMYAAIEARVARMVEAGALNEAAALAERGLAPGLPAMKALGVADLAAAARGEVALDAALERHKTATRNYAKRQVTWFQGQMVADFMFLTKFSEREQEEIFSKIL